MSKMGELALELQQKEMEEAWEEYERMKDLQDAQDALPTHKREDYSEKMAGLADHLRDIRDDR
jgi:hypothetical protein